MDSHRACRPASGLRRAKAEAGAGHRSDQVGCQKPVFPRRQAEKLFERTSNGRSWPAPSGHERLLRRPTTPTGSVGTTGGFGEARRTGLGRNDSSASGSLRASNQQRRLSGDESERPAVATRPIPARQPAPKLPDGGPGVFAFRVYEAVVRGLRRPGQERVFTTGRCGAAKPACGRAHAGSDPE